MPQNDQKVETGERELVLTRTFQAPRQIVDADGNARVTFRAEYPTSADLQQVLDMGMLAGMTETLDRLDEHLAERA